MVGGTVSGHVNFTSATNVFIPSIAKMVAAAYRTYVTVGITLFSADLFAFQRLLHPFDIPFSHPLVRLLIRCYGTLFSRSVRPFLGMGCFLSLFLRTVHA